MLLGLGIDLVHLPGFREQLSDTASSFVDATFTEAELRYADDAVSGDRVRHLAARYAAKEAALKALDQACAVRGIAPSPVPLLDIEVARDDRGRPWLQLHNAAAALAEEAGVDRAHLSLTHDGESAAVVVILERLG